MLGQFRFMFARFVMPQGLQTLPCCHMQAFAALGGVPIEILCDRMKTAVTGEDDQGHIAYTMALAGLDFINRAEVVTCSGRLEQCRPQETPSASTPPSADQRLRWSQKRERPRLSIVDAFDMHAAISHRELEA